MTYEEANNAYGSGRLPIELIGGLDLIQGAGQRSYGLCVMQVAAWVAGEADTDHPACASRVITDVAIQLNDDGGDDMRRALRGRAVTIAGSANAMLDDARMLALFQAFSTNVNELFALVTNVEDRAILAPFIESISAAAFINPSLERCFEAAKNANATLRTTNLASSEADALVDVLTDYSISFAYEEQSVSHAATYLISVFRSIDRIFGTDWDKPAASDPNHPQPGERSLAALDKMLAVTKPILP